MGHGRSDGIIFDCSCLQSFMIRNPELIVEGVLLYKRRLCFEVSFLQPLSKKTDHAGNRGALAPTPASPAFELSASSAWSAVDDFTIFHGRGARGY